MRPPALSGWRATLVFWTALVSFFLSGVMIHAGALGLAMIIAISAGLVLPATYQRFVTRPHWLVWAGLLFFAWMLLSVQRSPYVDDDILSNPVKVVLITAICGIFAASLNALPADKGRKALLFLSLIFGLLTLTMSFDLFSDFALTRLFDSDLAPADADALRNISRGLAVMVMLFPLIFVVLLREGLPGRIAALVIAALLIAACWKCMALPRGVFANVLALILIVPAMALAWWIPRKTVLLGFTGLAGLILVAPLFGLWAAGLTPAEKAALPFSFEWRAEMWSYLWERIQDKPLTGWGFDSLRTFDDTMDMRGFEDLTIVSMHAHNIGLHIWAELGAVGAVLAAGFLILTGFRVASARRLTKPQAVALAGSLAAMAALFFSYGAWQEWLWATFIWLAGLFALAGPVTSRYAEKPLDY